MKAIYALYASPESAQRAVNSLRSAGVEDADITILSSEPLEHYEFGQRDQKSWIWSIAAVGGIAGFTVGALLTSLTQLAWPLNTGGMPIVSIWPNMIPIFELTMLGAILSAVVTLIITARLGRKPPELYDPAVSDGKILIGVADPPEAKIGALETALQAGELKRI